MTKCPENISREEQNKIKSELNVESHQNLFFSNISYSNTLMSKERNIDLEDLKYRNFTLVTGIANPKPLINYLKEKGFKFNHKVFKDHHDFTTSEVNELHEKELIITTEKDYVRLKDKLESDKFFYLPITSKVFNAEALDTIIKSFVQSC